MDLKSLQHHWNKLGEEDAYWAVLTEPSKINNQWETDAFYKTGHHHYKHIFKKVGLENMPSQKRILDFGCGPGRITQAFCKDFEQVVGVDISPSMIEKANAYNKFPQRCSYFVNGKNDLSQFQDSSFDVVFSFITLQHIRPVYILKYLEEFVRITAKGGYILFNLPSSPPFLYQMIHRFIGHAGLNFARKLYFRKKWIIEMHWIAKTKLIPHVSSFNVQLISETPDDSVGLNWESYFYVFQKE